MIVWVKVLYPGRREPRVFLRWFNGSSVRVRGRRIAVSRASTVKGRFGRPIVYLKASCRCTKQDNEVGS